MIEVIRAAESAEADWVEAELRELVLGYERVVVALGEVDFPLPAIRQDGRLVSGREGLLQALKELELMAEAWRRFQSDACYVDDEGECL